MSTVDQPGKFYLGRLFDLKAGRVTDQPVMYPSRHLTTHAIIVGMTGSGKTGLGIGLLEEALLQGIPVLAVDPKGDLANLLLTFPNLAPEDFAPWVDQDQAQRDGMTVAQAAEQAARRWREGLAQWGIGPERIARLRQSVEFTIFTPGSDAGTPVNVLYRFRQPDSEKETDSDLLRERVTDLVTALLGLAGRETDPLQSSEHVFLSHLVEHAWRTGQAMDMSTLIRMVQDPPLRQIGAFDLESFLPQKERMGLARALNNIFAAPGFATWQQGVPLEVGSLLRTEDGRPRASIFYLAHLGDAERAFFITLLLGAVRDWMAAQSGTSDLRAILYFDEVFGFFPPHPASPPTKAPLMALIKQGRAAGLGVVLSTQNPADLDYKGLTNAGTWIVGTLRTDRDKMRVLEGLEGAISTAGAGLDRAAFDRALGSLKPRVFVLHDIQTDAPVFFNTRWAMSYLRGPLTRAQVRELCAAAGPAAAPRPEEQPAPSAAAPAVSPPPAATSLPPTLPSSIAQVFLPANVTAEWALHQHEQRAAQKMAARTRRLVYMPRLLAWGTVYLNDERKGLRHRQVVARLLEPPAPPAPTDWDTGEVRIAPDQLAHAPVGEGEYLTVPAHLAQPANYDRWSKAFADHLYRAGRVTLLYNPTLKVYGKPGESRHDFRVRCEGEVRARRDAEVDKVREKFDRQARVLDERRKREERELAADREELAARKREEALGGAESVFNVLTGRRSSSIITSASRRRRLTQQAQADVTESEQVIADLQQQLKDLAAERDRAIEEVNARWAATLDEIEEAELTPRRTDVVVDFCGLAWVPMWEIEGADGQRLTLPAYEPSGDEGASG